MNELALFAGAGGGILGGKLLGWRTVCAVERDAYAAQVLSQRQNDGCLEPFPIWSDVRSFDGRPWAGIVDVISGGFPCQDISSAGRGAGITGARSGLWSEFARIIGEVRPQYVFVENSPMLTSRGLGTVLGDLAACGYDAEWGCLSCAEVGGNHKRDRIWILATNADSTTNGVKYDHATARHHAHENDNGLGDANYDGQIAAEVGNRIASRGDNYQTKPEQTSESSRSGKQHAYVADADGAQRKGNQCAERTQTKHTDARSASWWPVEPDVGRVANGVAHRVDRLKAIGNGQVPRVAAAAFTLLLERIENGT